MENGSRDLDSPSEYIKSLVEQYRATFTLPPGIDLEEILSIDIDARQWSRLEDELDFLERDEKFPKFFYDPSASRLSIEWMWLPIHGLVVELFTNALCRMTRHIDSLCTIRSNCMFIQHTNDNDRIGNIKVSNLAFQSGKREKALIVEVGFSHTYDQLVRIAKFWLEGSLDVKKVVLVKITEPKYSCPIQDSGNSWVSNRWLGYKKQISPRG